MEIALAGFGGRKLVHRWRVIDLGNSTGVP
jgi:hypothetical protein